jgi:methyltransferase (TIGR00027 family)
MSADENLIRDVSDTALWTAAYRADESERPDALFRDPLARRLAGERGAEIARKVKTPVVRTAVVLRAAVFDRMIASAVRERGFDLVLNLAAGLDTRPYRMDLPADLRWVEVDMPALVAYKDAELAGEVTRCKLKRVPLDLADREARVAFFSHVAGKSSRVLAVTEGLLSYLAPEEVASLADDLRAQPAFAEWLTDLSGAQVIGRVHNAGDELKAEGQARARFAPAEGTAFFEPHGWVEVEFRDLFEEAPKMGRDSLLARVLRLLTRLAPAQKRKGLMRAVGVVRFQQRA